MVKPGKPEINLKIWYYSPAPTIGRLCSSFSLSNFQPITFAGEGWFEKPGFFLNITLDFTGFSLSGPGDVNFPIDKLQPDLVKLSRWT